MPKDPEFVLLRPIHFPDGTEAKSLPQYPDMVAMFANYLKKCIDRERSARKETGSDEP